MPLLSEVDLDQTIEDEEYRKELHQLQERLGELHNRLYRKKVPVIMHTRDGMRQERAATSNG